MDAVSLGDFNKLVLEFKKCLGMRSLVSVEWEFDSPEKGGETSERKYSDLRLVTHQVSMLGEVLDVGTHIVQALRVHCSTWCFLLWGKKGCWGRGIMQLSSQTRNICLICVTCFLLIWEVCWWRSVSFEAGLEGETRALLSFLIPLPPFGFGDSGRGFCRGC